MWRSTRSASSPGVLARRRPKGCKARCALVPGIEIAPSAGAAAAAFVGLVALAAFWAMPPAPMTLYTGPGEQRTIALADGTQLTMNTRSNIEVRMSRSKREVRIFDGEVFFAVAKDPSRPFLVETALGTARAVGTRFNVLADSAHVEVATEEGKVWVATSSDASTGVMATAGLRATLVRGGSGPVLDKADLSRVENWRARRLEFDNVPLDAALKEFSRYTDIPIRPATQEIGQIPVSAVLKVGDMNALRATLKGSVWIECDCECQGVAGGCVQLNEIDHSFWVE